LRTNFSWMLTGNVAYAASQAGMLVVFARFLSPVEVGQFALGLAVASPLLIFLGLELRQVLATDASEEFGFGDYLALRVLAVGVVVAALTGYAVVSQSSAALVVALVGVTRGLDALSDLLFGLFGRHRQMDVIGKSRIIRSTLGLAVVAVVVAATQSLPLALCAMAAVWAAVLVAYEMPRAARLLGRPPRPRWRIRELARLAVFSFPLGLVVGLGSVEANLPRYVIDEVLGKGRLGVFAVVAYLAVAATVVNNAIGESIAPTLANDFAAGRTRDYWRLLTRVMAGGAVLGIAVVAVVASIGERVLAVLFGAAYAEGSLFVWVAVSSGLSLVASPLNYALTAARRFRVQMPITALAFLGVAGASFLLVPSAGLIGAAQALVVGMGVRAVLGLAALLRAVPRRGVPW
jgi:O-antigen/teichoic acid export membrane protein